MRFCVSLVFTIVIYGACNAVLLGQSVPTTSDPEVRRQRDRDARNAADLEQRMDAMHDLDNKLKTLNKLDSRTNDRTPTLDKKARERMMTLRRIDPRDIAKYADFLTAKKTGIFRLFPDLECVTKNVVRIDGECVNFVPLSSSFSFRDGNYTEDESYHDIGFDRDEIVSRAFFSQGILVPLGDIPIDQITLAHPGLKFLVDFHPARDTATARLSAQENSTFALRMIAYKIGNSLPPISDKSTMTELRFLSLALDKRADLISGISHNKKGREREYYDRVEGIGQERSSKNKIRKG